MLNPQHHSILLLLHLPPTPRKSLSPLRRPLRPLLLQQLLQPSRPCRAPTPQRQMQQRSKLLLPPPMLSRPLPRCSISSAFAAAFRQNNPPKRCAYHAPSLLPPVVLQHACGARDVYLQVCRRCRWVPPLGSQIRHDAEDASKVNSLAGVATLFCMSSFFAPFYWLSNALSCAQASVRLTRVCSLEPERIAQLRVYQPNNFTASVIR